MDDARRGFEALRFPLRGRKAAVVLVLTLVLACSESSGGDGAAGQAIGGASGAAGNAVAGQGAQAGISGQAGAAGASGASAAIGAAGAAGVTAGFGSSGANGGAGASGAAGSGGASGASGAAGTDAGTGATNAESAAALEDLITYLAEPRDSRAPIADLAFASVALTRADAEQAQSLLWEDFAAHVRDTRASEVGATESQAATVQVEGSSLRYYMAVTGEEPAGGRSLFISMHGGGNAGAATNDSQWENQIALVTGYDPQDAIWVAPRAPIDDWNMWFVEQIDPLFDRLISNLIVFEGVNPNKVYLNGYSAGGDGVYQLGPRMADRWAGAAMSAGHPNDASPLNLRNLAFAIHVGGNDTAYERNLRAQDWGQMLEALAAADPGSYEHQWQVHAGLPHWMNLEDAVAIPFVQGYERNPVPSKVIWRQANVTQSRFYWLAVDQANEATGTHVVASYEGSTVSLSEVMGLSELTIRLSDAMLDLDQPVSVELDGNEIYSGMATRTIAVLARTLEERGDPALVWSAELSVDLE